MPGRAPYPQLSQYYSADAILHYNAPGTQPPKSSEYEAIRNASIPHSSKCTKENLCLAVNCPAHYHPTYYMNCTFIHQLKLLFPAPVHEHPLNEPEPKKGREIFFNFASEGLGQFVSVNGRMLKLPSVPLQLITNSMLNFNVCVTKNFGRVKIQIVVIQGIHILLKCHVVLFRLDCAVRQDVICIEDQLAGQRN